jgi:hypothetical protein
MRSFSRLGVLALPLIFLAACGGRSSVAYGDANSIIFVAPDSIWAEAGTTIQQVLEPRILTVRNERTFDLTPVSPGDPDLQRLRLWRQVLVVGEASDPWVAAVLAEGAEPPATLPAIVERDNIWARGQRVTAVVLPPGGGAAALVSILPELHQLLDQRFRDYAQARMFVSGRNDSLRAALRTESGFGLLLPSVYTIKHPDEQTYLFRNDNMVGGQLVRMIQVTWRAGADADLSRDAVLDWRDRAGAGHYWPVQETGRDLLESRGLEGFGAGGLEVRGAWSGDLDGYPMAGPFITRAIRCPEQDRTYLLDSWLYAPAKDKYEYMLQLETILNTFECGA